MSPRTLQAQRQAHNTLYDHGKGDLGGTTVQMSPSQSISAPLRMSPASYSWFPLFPSFH